MKIRQRTVKDICSLLVQEPSVISSGATVDQALKKMLEDQRTHHVYVLNEHNQLVGSVRLNDIVEFIMSYLPNVQDNSFEVFLSQFLGKSVSAIMIQPPLFLKEEALLEDILSVMIQERVNELPVVNQNNNVIGEVNFLEFIKFLSDHKTLQEEK